MMASGIARCAVNAILDDVNFLKDRYFKGTMSERTGESVLQNVIHTYQPPKSISLDSSF